MNIEWSDTARYYRVTKALGVIGQAPIYDLLDDWALASEARETDAGEIYIDGWVFGIRSAYIRVDNPVQLWQLKQDRYTFIVFLYDAVSDRFVKLSQVVDGCILPDSPYLSFWFWGVIRKQVLDSVDKI